jgi:hypothetical protein
MSRTLCSKLPALGLAVTALALSGRARADTLATTPQGLITTDGTVTNGALQAVFNDSTASGSSPDLGTWSAGTYVPGTFNNGSYVANSGSGSGDITYLDNSPQNQLSTNHNSFDFRIYNANGTTTDYSDVNYGSQAGRPTYLGAQDASGNYTYLLQSQVVNPGSPTGSNPATAPYYQNIWGIPAADGSGNIYIQEDVQVSESGNNSVIYDTFYMSNYSDVTVTAGLRATRDFKTGSDDAPQAQIQTITWAGVGQPIVTQVGPGSSTANEYTVTPSANQPTVVNAFSTVGGTQADFTLGYDPNSNPSTQIGYGPTTAPTRFSFVDGTQAASFANAFTFNSVTTSAEIANVTASDLANGNDTAGLFWWGDTRSDAFSIGASGGQAYINQGILIVAPEPSATALVLLAGTMFFFRRRRPHAQ